MLIGYCRASNTGQSLTNQRDQLLNAGCEKIFEEKLTGAEHKRPQLARLLNEIENGDTLVITSLDRLVRSTHDLLKITRLFPGSLFTGSGTSGNGTYISL